MLTIKSCCQFWIQSHWSELSGYPLVLWVFCSETDWVQFDFIDWQEERQEKKSSSIACCCFLKQTNKQTATLCLSLTNLIKLGHAEGESALRGREEREAQTSELTLGPEKVSKGLREESWDSLFLTSPGTVQHPRAFRGRQEESVCHPDSASTWQREA